MIYVALIEASVLMIAIATFAGQVRNLTREQARERQLLINQILHLSGKPWTPPPADTWQPEPEEPGRYVTTPEQLPDDEDWERDR